MKLFFHFPLTAKHCLGFYKILHILINFFSFSALPEHATLIRAECTFDRDSCAWRNTTTGDFEWRMAAVARRPANLPDKTYGMLLDLFITVTIF